MQRFKTVNELFGYEVGDNVLRSAADIFQNSFLKPLAFGRLEADRFAALVDVDNLDFERLPELLHGYHSQGNISMDIYGKCGIYYVDKFGEVGLAVFVKFGFNGVVCLLADLRF